MRSPRYDFSAYTQSDAANSGTCNLLDGDAMKQLLTRVPELAEPVKANVCTPVVESMTEHVIFNQHIRHQFIF